MFEVTAQARAEVEKGRKKRERERMGEAADMAGERARGALEAAEDCEGAVKAITDRGATPGPGTFTPPGQLDPEDAHQPYLAEGHAAQSPMNQSGAPSVQHVDLTQQRGVLTPLNPHSPMPIGGPR